MKLSQNKKLKILDVFKKYGLNENQRKEILESSIMGNPQDPRNKKHMFFKNGRWAVKTEGTDSSDYTDPTAQHDGVMKAVNVEENENFSDDEEKMPSKKQTSNKETELKYLNNTILGPDGKPLTWKNDDSNINENEFDEKLIKRFRKNANIGENTDWENYNKSIANAQSHEERQAIMKAYIAKSGPMGSSHTDIYKKQKDEPEKFKSKFHGMTPDAVAKYRAEHPKEEPPTESPTEKVDEMWAIPSNDSVEVRNGWPLRRKKFSKSSDERKSLNIVEDLDEIVRRIGIFNEMVESGCGNSIINDSLIEELDKEYEQIRTFESIDDMDEGTSICGWCQKKIGDIPNTDDKFISHGICPSCEKDFFEQLPPENKLKTDVPTVLSNEPSVDETAKKYPSYSTSNKIHPYADVEKISADRQTLRDLIPITKKLNVNVEEEPSSDVPIKHIKPETPEIDEFKKFVETVKQSRILGE